MSDKLSIEFVNHACFIVETGKNRILVDPWLTGNAFNLGWALQIPTPSKYLQIDENNKVTHIIFTHEHPDHFNPVWLSSIPEELRRAIIVFFQKTRDRRVVNFCEKLGFQVIELPPKKSFPIDANISLFINPVPFIDSLFILKVGDFTILNLNDCVTSSLDLKWIKNHFKIDLLLTQFSYANWAGDPIETNYRASLAADALVKFSKQIEVIKPKFVIPFASFVYFSHKENWHLNDHRNSVAMAVSEIRELGATPVVLAPGDVWKADDSWNNSQAIEKYMNSMQIPEEKLLEKPESVPLPELQLLAEKYAARIRINNRLALWLISKYPFRVGKKICIYLYDLNVTVKFDPRNGNMEFFVNKDLSAKIEMASDSFAFILKFDYGSNTLAINGRFRASIQAYRDLLKAFSIANLNNGGRLLSINLILEYNFVSQAIKRVIAG